MEITIHHISGSRAGETESFSDAAPIRIGRSAENQVRLDPEQDRVVSGTHAELVSDGENWTIRDLKSTNGTFIGSERITERRLAPGEIVQFGKDGPRLRVDFVPPRPVIPATVIEELPKSEMPPVGRTVMMSLPSEARSHPEAPRPVDAAAVPRRPAPKKKGRPLKALLVVFGVLFALIAAAIVAAFMIRQANLRRRAQIAEARQQDVKRAEQVTAQIAKQSAQVAAQVTRLAEVQNAPAQTSGESVEDLRRELEDSRRKLEEQQRIEDELTRKLQETNDQLATAKAQPPRVRVRHLPAPVPAAAVRPPVKQEPGPAAGPATAQQARVVSAGAAPATAPAAAANVANAPTSLYTGKVLKRKVAVAMAPSPVALTNLPSGTARDLASLLASALESTGKFVSDTKAPASVGVSVTNFGSTTRTTDPTRAVNNANRLSRLFGRGLPDNPVDARTTSSDAMLSLKVDLFDQAGRQLAEVQPEAEAANRSSGFAVASVPFKQLAGTDTPVGDVIRKVVADSVDALAPALQRMEWSSAVIVQQQQGTAIVAAGRNSGVDIGDTFDVVDSSGRPTARVKVTTVAPDTATAEVLSTSSKKLGTTARYIGSESSASQPSATDRWLITRAATPAFDGPGTSFKTVKTFKANSRLRFEYAVGGWAKVTDSGASSWVPLASGRIIG